MTVFPAYFGVGTVSVVPSGWMMVLVPLPFGTVIDWPEDDGVTGDAAATGGAIVGIRVALGAGIGASAPRPPDGIDGIVLPYPTAGGVTELVAAPLWGTTTAIGGGSVVPRYMALPVGGTQPVNRGPAKRRTGPSRTTRRMATGSLPGIDGITNRDHGAAAR
jgi:hypothetical protein